MKFKRWSVVVLVCAALFSAAAVQAQEKLEIFSWWAGDEGPALEALHRQVHRPVPERRGDQRHGHRRLGGQRAGRAQDPDARRRSARFVPGPRGPGTDRHVGGRQPHGRPHQPLHSPWAGRRSSPPASIEPALRQGRHLERPRQHPPLERDVVPPLQAQGMGRHASEDLGRVPRDLRDAEGARASRPRCPSVRAWTVNHLWESVALGVLGPDNWAALWTGKLKFTDPKVVAVWDMFGKVLAYTNADASGLSWQQATDRLVSGDSAFNIMGDWAAGYMSTTLRLVPGRGLRLGRLPLDGRRLHDAVRLLRPAQGDQEPDRRPQLAEAPRLQGRPGHLQPAEGLDRGPGRLRPDEVQRVLAVGGQGLEGQQDRRQPRARRRRSRELHEPVRDDHGHLPLGAGTPRRPPARRRPSRTRCAWVCRPAAAAARDHRPARTVPRRGFSFHGGGTHEVAEEQGPGSSASSCCCRRFSCSGSSSTASSAARSGGRSPTGGRTPSQALAANPVLRFVGLANYRELFTGLVDGRFRQDLVSTIFFTVFFIARVPGRSACSWPCSSTTSPGARASSAPCSSSRSPSRSS